MFSILNDMLKESMEGIEIECPLVSLLPNEDNKVVEIKLEIEEEENEIFSVEKKEDES